MLRHPAVSVAAGGAAVAVGGATAAYRNMQRLPVVGSLLRRGVAALSERGDTVITQSIDPVKTLVAAIAVHVVELVLDEIDLTALVCERVNIDAVAADVDIDAIVERIDLIGLANKVVDGVDLPAIIRESTTSMTADVMTDIRGQSERADDFVGAIVGRMLRRSAEPR